MKRSLLVLGLVAFLALVSGPLFAEEPGTDGDKPEGEKDKDTKKVDKYLGIDWGDETGDKDGEKTENPDDKQPANKVDLEQALDKSQKKRLENILKTAERGDKLVEQADKAYRGEDKRLKKIDSIKLYDNAAKIYRGVAADIEKLAKGIKEEDTRLTLLREYGDKYRDKACEMWCKAASVIIEEAKTLKDLSLVGGYLKQARQLNKDYPGIATTLDGARLAAAAIEDQVKKAADERSSGGGEKDKEERWDDPRPDRDYKETGREDYKKTGR